MRLILIALVSALFSFGSLRESCSQRIKISADSQGVKISAEEAQEKLAVLFEENLILSTEPDSRCERFQFAVTGVYPQENGTSILLTAIVERDGKRMAALLLGPNELPLLYYNQDFLVCLSANRTPPLCGAPVGRLNVLPVDLNDIRLNADDKKGPDVIRANFRELLEAEIETATEWLYEEQSRMLACSCKSGILLVRFAGEDWQDSFPIASIRWIRTNRTEIIWHRFYCDRKPPMQLAKFDPSQMTLPLSGAETYPEITVDPLGFFEKYGADPLILKAQSDFLRDFDYSTLGIISEKALVPYRRFLKVAKEREVDLSDIDSVTLYLYINYSRRCTRKEGVSDFSFDHQNELVIHVREPNSFYLAYDRRRAATEMALALGKPLADDLRETLFSVAMSDASIEVRTKVLFALSLIGFSDCEFVELRSMTKIIKEKEPERRIADSYTAFLILCGHTVSEKRIEQLKKSIGSKEITWQESAFYLDALCQLKQIEGFEELLHAIYSHDPSNFANMVYQKRILGNILRTPEGLSFAMKWLPENEQHVHVWQAILYRLPQLKDKLKKLEGWPEFREYLTQAMENEKAAGIRDVEKRILASPAP